jgi:pimeloyl-ACP methyl ester carboxylesterase
MGKFGVIKLKILFGISKTGIGNRKTDTKHESETAIRKHKKGRIIVGTILAIILFIIVALIIIILPPSKGKIPQYLDDNGNVLAGSVSEKAYLDVDGTKLGMIIKGIDQTKPVMLLLGGGPGIPEYFLEETYPTGLTERFVVCYLEYRGTSLSYQPDLKAEKMTTERFLQDVEAVTNYLMNRFHKEKIFLMGHSFGTYLGLQMAYRHPKYYTAYIAMSQLTYPKESERIAAQYMKERYRALGQSKKVNEFEALGDFSSDAVYQKYFNSLLRDNSMHELGIGTTHNMKSVITGIFLPSLRCRAYTQLERINIWRGKSFMAATPVAVDRTKYNSFDDVKSLEIPVYFLGGKYDYTCCYSLQKEYYEQIQALLKGFYTFENSAHSPMYEEPEKAMRIMEQDVLKGINNLADK